MPVFPQDGDFCGGGRWTFFRIDRAADGAGIIDVIPYRAPERHETAADAIPLDGGAAARIMHPCGGGWYPQTHTALTHLMHVLGSRRIRDLRVPLIFNPLSDIIISRYHDPQKGVCPFVLTAEQMTAHPGIDSAFKKVMQALRKDASSALEAWRFFPEDFALRREAEAEIDALYALRPPPEGRRKRALAHGL